MELERVFRRFYSFGSKSVPILLAVLILFVTCASAQNTTHDTPASQFPTSDAEKIADALRAGPIFITKDATISIGQRPKAESIASCARARASGPACLRFPGMRMTNPAVSMPLL